MSHTRRKTYFQTWRLRHFRAVPTVQSVHNQSVIHRNHTVPFDTGLAGPLWRHRKTLSRFLVNLGLFITFSLSLPALMKAGTILKLFFFHPTCRALKRAAADKGSCTKTPSLLSCGIVRLLCCRTGASQQAVSCESRGLDSATAHVCWDVKSKMASLWSPR